MCIPWGRNRTLPQDCTIQFSSVAQSLSRVQLFATPGTAACQASLYITNSQSLLKLMSIELMMSSNHFILSSPSPPAFNLSQHQGLFQWVTSLHQVAKVFEFQLQHQSFHWIFRTDFHWDGLVGSPCSPRDSQESFPTPQLKSINSSVFSFLYSPTLTSIRDYWKTIALTRPTLVGKVMSLLLNMLSKYQNCHKLSEKEETNVLSGECVPRTFLCSIFAGFSLLCLLVTIILDAFFLFHLSNNTIVM